MYAALYEQALELAPSNNTSDTLYMLRASRELAQLRQRQGHTEDDGMRILQAVLGNDRAMTMARLAGFDSHAF